MSTLFSSDVIEFRPLEFPRDEEGLIVLARSLYAGLDEATLRTRLNGVKQDAWEAIGAFGGPDADTMIGMSGFWIQNRLCYGRFLYIDHFIVENGGRKHGLGHRMWNELERIARLRDCERLVLDTFVTNPVAQRFWMKRGCDIVGFHFGKTLG